MTLEESTAPAANLYRRMSDFTLFGITLVNIILDFKPSLVIDGLLL